MIRKSVFAFAVLLALAGAASASQLNMQVSISKADFEATRAHLVAQLDSDRFSEINASDKTAVIAALDRIADHLTKSPDQMSDQDRVDIFNDQELINEIATHAIANSRLFCEREAPTGSHLVRVTCLPMKTWMEREESGQTSMHGMQHGSSNTCTASSMGRAPAGCGN